MSSSIERLSEDSSGGYQPSLSSDGRYVAFEGAASVGLFVLDRTTGLISEAPEGGTTANGYAYGKSASLSRNAGPHDGSISADGKKLVFESEASNGAFFRNSQIFVEDLATNVVTLVSTTSSEQLPDGDVSGATVSGNGNYAAFLSNSANLPGYTGAQQIYVKNLLTGELTLASADANGTPGARISPNNAGGSTNASLSYDGSLVLFRSTSPNFGSGPSIYIKSLVDGTLTNVSADAAYASDPSMSTDGTAVAYDGFGTNGLNGIFVSKGGHSTLVSTAADGTPGNGYSLNPKLSADGKYILFQSTATNLGPSDPAINGTNIETFVKDLVTGKVTLVFPKIGSETYSNPPSNGQAFSGDDSTAVFATGQGDLASGDTNDTLDAFAFSLPPSAIVPPSATPPAASGGGGATPGGNSAGPDASPPIVPNPPTNNSPAPRPQPALAFDPAITVSAGVVTLSGTISSGVSGVELFEGSMDLGAASIDPSAGTWTYSFHGDERTVTGIRAVATDQQGQQTAVSSGADLSIGIPGQPYSIEQDRFDGVTGAYLGSTYFRQNGAVYLQSSVTGDADGGSAVTYSEGTFFRRKSYSSFTDHYDAAGMLTQHVETNRSGSHNIEIDGNGVTTLSLRQDRFTELGGQTQFVFDPGVGHELITGFVVKGRGHDVVSLPDSDASRLASILAHAHTSGHGDTTISIGHGDTITFAGVSADGLRRHAGDFHFHA